MDSVSNHQNDGVVKDGNTILNNVKVVTVSRMKEISFYSGTIRLCLEYFDFYKLDMGN